MTTKRWFRRLSLIGLAAVLWVAGDACLTRAAESLRLYVGTYTGPKSHGIYRFALEPARGALTDGKLVAETRNPSFLAIHPNGRWLYAVNEVGDVDGQNRGAVSAFAIGDATGPLTPLNAQPSGGAAPCHLAVDGTGRYVLSANYTGGSVAVFPIRQDGGLASASAFVQHRGSSVNPRRQEGPHAHGIYLDAANRFAFVPDLGLDRVMVYRFDAARGTLTPHEPPFAALKPGAGPRHLAFTPDGRHAVVINELHSSVTWFDYDPAAGRLRERQTVSTLPEGYAGDNTTAEVAFHPNGRFVYGSNRGHNSLARFAADAAAGRLTPLGHTPTQGKAPRNFALDPTGRYLIAANQDSDNLVVFRVDPKSGGLSDTGQKAMVGSPVCVVFALGQSRALVEGR